jgi:hypothetical protein
MKKVISACLYGRDPFYVEGAIINATEAKDYYPGWEFWLYINRGHIALPRFQAIPGVKLIEMPVCRFSEGMCWRFLPDEDPEVEMVIYRDMDCRFSDREVSAVNEWVASGKLAHLMFESVHCGINHHGLHAHILGGLWGLRTGKIHVWREYQKWLSNNPNQLGYGADQRFLSEVIWPLIKDDVMVHCADSEEKEAQLRKLGIEVRPYPVKGNHVVGNKVPVWDCASYFPGPLVPASAWLNSRNVDISDSDIIGAVYTLTQLVKILESMGDRYHIAKVAVLQDLATLEDEAVKRGLEVQPTTQHTRFAYFQKAVKHRR